MPKNSVFLRRVEKVGLAGAGLGAYDRSELASRLQIEYVRALEVEPNGQFVANPHRQPFTRPQPRVGSVEDRCSREN